jgi:hypothetical protein
MSHPYFPPHPEKGTKVTEPMVPGLFALLSEQQLIEIGIKRYAKVIGLSPTFVMN